MWIRPKKFDGFHPRWTLWSNPDSFHATYLVQLNPIIYSLDFNHYNWCHVGICRENPKRKRVGAWESIQTIYIYIYIFRLLFPSGILIILESRIIFLTVKLKWMAEIDLNIKKTKGKNENLKGKKNFAARQTTKKKTIFLPILTQKRLFFLLIFFLFFLLFSSVSLSLSETISRLLFSLELWLSVSILNFTSPLAPITSYSHFSRK